MATPLLFSLFLCAISWHVAMGKQYNVVSYGADEDGRGDSTSAFASAWEGACASPSSSTMHVPTGRFYVRKMEFAGPCKGAISVTIGGTLVAPTNFQVIGDSESWITFRNVDNVRVRGGSLDGRGASLWSCKVSNDDDCPKGSTSLVVLDSKNVMIEGLASRNSQMFHIVVRGSHNIRLHEIDVSAPADSPNTDGIHVQSSSNVTITSSRVRTGDDCISIGPGTNNTRIENITCGPGHGISIGSLAKNVKEQGVRNVVVNNVKLSNTQNGVRIKTWGRPSNGFARDILFQNVAMFDVHNPIIIDQNYCPHKTNCPGKASGAKLRNVTYCNIYGTSKSSVAVKFDCSRRNPCIDIKLDDINLSYQNGPAEATCTNVYGRAYGFQRPATCLED